MIESYKRGHVIVYDNGKWIYKDTKKSIDIERPCKRCGKMPTKEGYDYCKGHQKGKISVCCGHGVEEEYTIKQLLTENC